MKRPFDMKLMFSAVLLLCGAGLAQAVTVDGVVRDPDGVAIGGIEVSIFRDGGDDVWSVYSWRQTSADGSWSMTGVPAGRYRLKLFDWSQRYAYEFYDNVTFFDEATNIEIAADDVTIDVVIEPGGTITGTVSTPGGAPLENPAVVVFDANGDLLYYETVFGTQYEVGGLATGDHLLRFSGAQFGSDQQWSYFLEWYDDVPEQDLATPVPVVAGTQTSGIDAFMGFDAGGSISGVVVDLYGRAFTSARVEAWQETDTGWEMVRGVDTSDYYDDGEYTLDLPPGTYRLRFEGSTEYNLANSLVEWWQDAPTRDQAVDVVLQFNDALIIDGVLGELAPGSIAGTVTDSDGLPLAGIEVSIRGFSGELYYHFTRTAVDGSYQIDGLPPDDYLLEFFDPNHEYRWSYLGGTQNPAGAERVLVSLAAVTGVDQILIPGGDPGSVTGFVTDPMGNPAPGVRVQAVSAGDGTTVTGSGSVRADGSYRLRDQPTGEVIVGFRDPSGGFVDQWFDDAPTSDDATPVAVTFGTPTEGISAVLETAGGIAGRVVDAFGRPFTLTSINAYAFDGGSWVPIGGAYNFEESDYFLGGLPAGTYRVVFSGGGWWGDREVEWFDDAPSVDLATDVDVVDGVVTSGIDAVLGNGPGGAIRGTVTDGSDEPVAGVEVRLYDESLALRNTGTVTGSDGRYAVEPLYSGLYYVEFVDPNGLPTEFFDDAGELQWATPIIIGGSPIDGVDAVLDGAGTGPGGGVITGSVTDEATGLGLGGIRVSCYSPDLSDQPPCWTTTAADGFYELGGNLPAGQYRVRFSDPAGAFVSEFFDDAATSADATSVPVDLGVVSGGVDAALAGAGGIAGTVTDAAGAPLAKLLVTAFREVDGEWRQVDSTMNFYQSQYALSGLEPGVYRVRFADGYEGFFTESEFWDDASTIETATDVIVDVGTITTGIDAVLREDLPGGITGVVTDESGSPLAGIDVSVYDREAVLIGQVQTDGSGTYEALNVLPGWYWVGFEDPTGMYPPEFFADVASLDLATPVSVGYTIVTGINAVLDGPGDGQGGSAVEGTVVDGDTGIPLAGIMVRCFEESGFAIPRCTEVTDADGRYRLGGFLPAEPVMVRFEDPNGGYFPEWYDDAVSFVDATPVPLVPGGTATGVDAGLLEGTALLNPSFDSNLDGWSGEVPLGAGVAHSPFDAHGDPGSGSAWVGADGAPDGVVTLEQCLPVDAGPFTVGGRVRIESIGDPMAAVAFALFADGDCNQQSSAPMIRRYLTGGSTANLWRDLQAEVWVPEGTGSVVIRFEVHANGAENFEAYWDALYAAPSHNAIFFNGFESGNFQGWTMP